MKEIVQELAHEVFPLIVQNRRHLHMHPELSFEEVETGRYIARQLEEIGVSYRHGIAENGLIAMVKGKNPKKRTIALRADIDALPILEANEVSYKSQNPGVMHACGHDVHTASLLGTIRVLHRMRDKFEGTVKCLFQPGEEKLPGGASIMIREGALENPKPASIFGQHVHPPLEVGKVGVRSGMYMASADELYLTIKGHGGHGAMPQDCIDPVVIAAQIIVGLQQVVSRYANPGTPSVLTFGKINSSGGATNIIPNEVRLEGTFRTMDEKWRNEAHKWMKKIANNIAKGYGGSVEFHIEKGYPVLFNHEKLTARAKRWMTEFLGPDQVVDMPLRMTAEDFAFYSHHLPACFYRLGTGNPEKGIISPVHTDTFDVDERALETGIGLMAWLALKELEEKS
ncbi:MAG: amidohydrolase [Bacteroidetes bacterium]|nr:amidohydrolase [Bacteroidota bacterium]